MPASHTLDRYLASEVAQYTVLAFLAAAPVILVPNIFDQVGDFLVIGVTAGDVLVVLWWVLVLIAGYALPIAFVFGLLLAMGRLQGDREILAMRSCGLGLFALARPVLAVGALLSVVAGAVSIGFEHLAWKQIEATKRRVMSRGAVIEPGRFHRFGKRTILAQERLDANHFGGIMISDYTSENKPMLIFAESAEYRFEPETGTLRLQLVNGDIRLDPYPNEEFEEHRISFATFDYAFLAPRLAAELWPLRPNQLTFGELRAVAAGESSDESPLPLRYRHPRHYESHMHRLLAIPLTPLLFSLIGIPVAILGFVRSRPRGTFLALLLLGAYYALFIFAYDAARNGRFAPLPAIWAPNALVCGLAAILLFATGRSRR